MKVEVTQRALLPLSDLISQAISLAPSQEWPGTDFALFHIDGQWEAAIGGHRAVMLGEYEGDVSSAQLNTPEEAVSELIEKLLKGDGK